MSNKGRIKPTSVQSFTTKAEQLDNSYLEKNIVLDFSFPYLFYFIRFNEFTNKFKSPKQYIEYFDYVHKVLLSTLNKTKCKSIFSNNDENFKKHTHVIDSAKQIILINNIIKSLYIANGLNEGLADAWIEQNIGDTTLWQVGLENGFGRIIGYFQDNIFKIILFDPHHLIYKEEKGKVRKHKDVSTYSFFPDKMNRFEFPKKCIRCGSEKNLTTNVKDDILHKDIFICDKCLLELIEQEI